MILSVLKDFYKIATNEEVASFLNFSCFQKDISLKIENVKDRNRKSIAFLKDNNINLEDKKIMDKIIKNAKQDKIMYTKGKIEIPDNSSLTQFLLYALGLVYHNDILGRRVKANSIKPI